MSKQQYAYEDVEVNIGEAILDLLLQWKAVLMVAIFAALLTCGIKYSKEGDAYHGDSNAESNIVVTDNKSDEEQIADIIDSIPEDDRGLVEYILKEQEWVYSQKQYVRDSVLMKTDSTRQRVLSMVFEIDVEDASALPFLIQYYYSCMQKENAISRIKPHIAPDAKDEYIRELFYENMDKDNSIEDVEGKIATIEINVAIPEEVDADAILKEIGTTINALSNTVQFTYPHSIRIVKSEEIRLFHKENVEKRNAVFESINAIEGNIKNAKTTLNDVQKKALEGISRIKEGTAGEYKAEQNEENDMIKYAFLGFALGCLLYAFVYIIWLMMRKRVNSAADVETYIGRRLLGELYWQGENIGLKRLMTSSFVKKYRYRNKTNVEDQKKKLETSIEAVMKHARADKTSILKMSTIKGLEKDDFKQKGMKVETIALTDDINEKEFLAIESAVIEVGKDTKVSDLLHVLQLCNEYDINVLGGIYTGTI